MAVVGDLVANLAVNTAGFTGPLGKAQGALKGFASGLGGSLGFLGGAIAGIGAPLLAALGIKEAIAGFRESEQAGKKLDAVLAATGNAAGVSGQEIRTLAADLQRVTNFEDDATIAAAGVLATFKQIKGDTFKAAIVAAQDLSAVMGTDLQGSIVQVGKALNDPIKGVTALRRVGVSFSAEQLANIKALQTSGDLIGAQAIIMAELQSEFGGAAAAMADPLTILGNTIGDIGEGIGSAIVPALNEIAMTIVGFIVPAGQSMQEVFTNVGTVLVDWVRAGIDFVRDGITVIGFAIENWQALAQLAFLNAQLAAVAFIEDIKHFFGTVLPTFFGWFSQNWSDIWFTALDTVLTVLINIGTNVRNLFSELWAFIASGGQDAFQFTFEPLLKGAINTISKLPDIPARAISEMEAGLTQDIGTLGTDLGNRLGETMLAAAAPTLEKPEFVPPSLAGTDFEGGDAKAGKKTGAAAAVQGSKEALSSIFANMRGEGGDVQKKLAKMAEQQLSETRDQTALLQTIADDDTEVIEISS